MADIKHQELPVRDELRAIRERCAEYPVLAPRTADEILGYDDQGLPALRGAHQWVGQAVSPASRLSSVAL